MGITAQSADMLLSGKKVEIMDSCTGITGVISITQVIPIGGRGVRREAGCSLIKTSVDF
jgi:hypothetical protein